MTNNNIKHIAKVLVSIFLFTFIADKIVFVVLNNISDKVFSGQSIGKLNHFLKVKESRKILFFGSSRTNHNIDPYQFDTSSFNMGVDGRDIAYVYTLIRLIDNKKPQTFFIQIDPEHFFDPNYRGDDLDALSILYNRNIVIKEEMNELNLDNSFQKLFWSISYNSKIFGIIRNFLKPKYDYKNYNGYDPINVDEQQKKIFEKILSQKVAAKCQDSLYVSKVYFNYLLQIKDFAKLNNKKLILFTSPVYNDACKEDNLQLSKIAKELKIEYFDFTDVFLKKNLLSYWRDETHLSRIGAEKFTKIMKESTNAKRGFDKSKAELQN